MKKRSKHPEEMSAAELAAATKEFEQPFAFENARPMTPSERIEESKLRGARPRTGKGAAKVGISIDKIRLKRADALARKKRVHQSGPRPAA